MKRAERVLIGSLSGWCWMGRIQTLCVVFVFGLLVSVVAELGGLKRIFENGRKSGKRVKRVEWLVLFVRC